MDAAMKVKIGADTSELEKKLIAAQNNLRNFENALKKATNVDEIGYLTRNIGLLKNQIASLQTAIPAVAKTKSNFTELSRVLQDLPYGFQGIQNNITQLVPAAGGLGLAFSAIVAAVSFAQIGFQNWTRGSKDAKAAADSLTNSLSNVNEIMTAANKDAAEQTTALKALYNSATNANIAMADRLKFVKELKEQFPDYFKDISNETILNGGAEASYRKLSAAILSTARAKAAKSKIDEIEAKRLDVEFQKEKIRNATTNEINRATATALRDEEGRAIVQYTKEENIKIIEARRDRALKEQEDRDARLKSQAEFLVKFAGGEKKIADAIVNPEAGGKEEKAKKKIKTIADAMEDLRIAMVKIDRSETVGAITPKDADTQRLNAYSTALNQLFERGATAANQNVKDVLEGMRQLRTIAFKDVSGPITARHLDGGQSKIKEQPLSVDPNQKLHILDQIVALQNAAAKGAKDYESAMLQVGQTLTTTFEGVFGAIQRGESVFQSLGNAVRALIIKLTAAAAAAFVLGAITGMGPAGSLGGFAKIFGQLSGFKGLIPHAEGGIFTGPTRIGSHLFGEAGPEALIPLNRMDEIMGKITGGGTQRIEIVGQLSNDVIYLANKRASESMGRRY